MTIAIPIITEFNGKGISSAIKEFKNLETNGERAHFAIQKAALPAAAALAGLTVALGDAVKGAIEDAAEQDKLAEQIKRTTGATDLQIKGVENFITAAGKQKGFTDNVLRPSMGGLVRATQDVEKAQELMTLAMDVATAKGVPLETVTKSLERAYGGNLTALAKLSPELRQMIKDGASLEEVMKEMSETFGGAASDAAETTAGKFARMKIALDETKESIGAALMPAVQAVLPYLQKFAGWAQENPGAFLAIAGAITAIASAILVYTAATKIAVVANALLATSFTALQVASGLIVFTALIAGLVVAYNKFQWFRDGVKAVINQLASNFEFMANAFIKTINVLITGINLIKPGKDIDKLGLVNIGRMGEGGGGGETSSVRAFEESQKKVVATSSGVFAPPTVAASAPGKIQNTEPPVSAMPSGTGVNTMAGGISGITINLEAGLISSPGTIGQDIIEAILAAQRDSGVVFAPAVTL